MWIFGFFYIFFLDLFGFFFTFVILFKVTKVTTKSNQGVTTEHQKWPKISQNSIISAFFAQRSRKQELEVGPRSMLYLLVQKKKNKIKKKL